MGNEIRPNSLVDVLKRNELVTTNIVNEGDIITNNIYAKSSQFGDVSGGNYSEFESDGTLKFSGDASVWEDLNFDPTRSGGPVATRPDDVIINNVIHKEFTSANNQFCGAVEEIPHEYKLLSTIYPHIHIFLKNGESAGNTGATFTFYWELRQASGVTNGNVPLSATSTQLGSVKGGNKLDIYDLTGISGPIELGAQIAVRIARTGGNAGDIVVTTYGIHYEIDSVGSKEINIK